MYYGSLPRHHTRSQTPIEKRSQTPVCARIRTPGTDDRSQTKIKRIVEVSQGITTAHRGNGSTFGSETPNTNAESNSRVTQNTCYEVWEEGLIGHWTCPIGSLFNTPWVLGVYSEHSKDPWRALLNTPGIPGGQLWRVLSMSAT